MSFARSLVVIPAMWFTCASPAQGLAPFATDAGRFVVFDRGRFVELEPRTPAQFVTVDDLLIYEDHGGDLKIYTHGRTDVLGHMPGGKLLSSRSAAIYRHMGRLYLVTSTGMKELAAQAGEVTVRDSIIAFHDLGAGQLLVRWRGGLSSIADVASDSSGVQWVAGSNTLVYHDRSTLRLKLWYRGELRTLCDSADFGLVACGGDAVAFMDPLRKQFRLFDHGTVIDLEEFRPIGFQAGAGLVAYVDVFGPFKCWRGGSVDQLLDHPPTAFWVKDSILVFIDKGRFMTERDGQALQVEAYIPEQWAVHGGTIYYLGLDRDVRSYRRGEWITLSKGSAIPEFKVWGDAIVHPDPKGGTTVLWNGKTYEY